MNHPGGACESLYNIFFCDRINSHSAGDFKCGFFNQFPGDNLLRHNPLYFLFKSKRQI